MLNSQMSCDTTYKKSLGLSKGWLTILGKVLRDEKR